MGKIQNEINYRITEQLDLWNMQDELKKQKIKNGIIYICLLINTISILILALKK